MSSVRRQSNPLKFTRAPGCILNFIHFNVFVAELLPGAADLLLGWCHWLVRICDVSMIIGNFLAQQYINEDGH
jgi:hypothetical protein